MKTYLITLILIVSWSTFLSSQHVGINETNPTNELEVKSTDPKDPAKLLLSNLGNGNYLHLESGTTSGGPRLWWKPGEYFRLATANIGGSSFSEFLRLDGKTIGVYNTGGSVFLGQDAGKNDDESDNGNVAIGRRALHNNASSSNNTAVGDSTLFYNTGNNNSAFGSHALLSNIGGYENSAFGVSALFSNNNGNKNTAVGSAALGFNNSNYNTAIGASSLVLNTTGQNNVAIGTEAGFINNGSDNVFIGYQAGMNETASNRLYISNSSASTPLLYGEFDNELMRVHGDQEITRGLKVDTTSLVVNPDNGFVGIGTETPSAELHLKDPDGWTYMIVESQPSGDAVLQLTDGLSGNNDDWTIRRDGSDGGKLHFKHNDIHRTTIQSNGWMGLGTTSPVSELHVKDAAKSYITVEAGAGNDAVIQLTDNTSVPDNAWTLRRAASEGGKLQFRHNNLTEMTLQSNGWLGLGTTAPVGELHIKDPGFSYVTVESGPGLDAVLQLTDNTTVGDNGWTIRRDGEDAGALRFKHDNTTRMTMKTTGELGIGVTDPSSKLTVDGVENNGTIATLEIRSPSNQKMLIDGNEIDVNGDLHLNANSNSPVTIGTHTSATGYMLSIGGKAMAEELRVQLSGAWPDYVFSPEYDLLSLEELEKSIEVNKHLPGMPKAKILEEQGLDLGEMQRNLVEKIEELTLYIIQLNKDNQDLLERIKILEIKNQVK